MPYSIADAGQVVVAFQMQVEEGGGALGGGIVRTG